MEHSKPVGKLTNQQLKDFAVWLMESYARSVEYDDVMEDVEDYPGCDAITDLDAHLVVALVDRATITVSWGETD